MDLAQDLQPIALAAVRITLFLVVAPPFNHGAVPGQVKAMLGVWLAVLLGPNAPATTAPDTADFLIQMITETLVGAGMGMLVRIVVAALGTAGRFIDITGGFEMASSFDPMSFTQGGPFGRFYSLLATVLLFVSDGYQVMIQGLVRSFGSVPLGVGLDMSVLADQIVVRLGGMFVAALQIAGPLMAVLFLVDVGFGLLSRAAPALNAFALGFPMKIFTTLMLGATLLVALPSAVGAISESALDALVAVFP